jgi:hypothetical protein
MPLNTSEDERLDALEARLGRFEECVQSFEASFVNCVEGSDDETQRN